VFNLARPGLRCVLARVINVLRGSNGTLTWSA
jgi:hypothetical protein